MDSLIEIQSRIAKLEQQATTIRSREYDSTLKEILAKMSAFGITVNDLKAKLNKVKAPPSVATKKSSKATKPKEKDAKRVVAAKFVGLNGETWTGRGLTPRWLAAQVALGRVKEEFLIKP